MYRIEIISFQLTIKFFIFFYLFRFDARGKPLQQATHWADENVLGNKAHFYYDTNPPALRIRDIKRNDAGLYRCRVDFQKSPTRNWRINLTVLGKSLQMRTRP